MSKYLCTVTVFVCSFQLIYCALPNYINVCQRNDPKLNDCISKSIYSLLPYLKKGIPELDVPPIEPLKLKLIPFRSGNDNTRFASNLTNIKIWDASTFQLKHIKANIPEDNFQFKVNIPTLRLEGDYDLDSKILQLELKGSGPFNINLTDFGFDCVLQGHRVQKKGNEHLEFDPLNCTVQFKRANVLFNNLFDRNPLLARSTNDVINDNFNSIFEDVKPTVLDALAETFTDIANKITLNFKYSDLFP